MTNSPPFIIDAGPALNFLASGHERLLTAAVGNQTIHAPQTVEDEVLRNARTKPKFRGAARRWRDMQPTWLHLLSDDSQDPALRQAAQALLATSLDSRQKNGDDLGETMVVLHAYIKAMAGEAVVVIIDDQGGRVFAANTSERVSRANRSGMTTGSIQMASTPGLINRRINTPDIPDQSTLAALWTDISPLDGGLTDDKLQRLVTSPRWNGPQQP